MLLWLKMRDTATGTVCCLMKPCRAHQKYNQQTLKGKQPQKIGRNKFGSQVCQLQAKGIWQTKCTMDASQAAKHKLLQKANVNLQGCSTLQEINSQQVSREDHFHLYSCISQDLFSVVNTHQQGLKSHARAAIYRHRSEFNLQQERSPRCCSNPDCPSCHQNTPKEDAEGTFLQKQWNSIYTYIKLHSQI